MKLLNCEMNITKNDLFFFWTRVFLPYFSMREAISSTGRPLETSVPNSRATSSIVRL